MKKNVFLLGAALLSGVLLQAQDLSKYVWSEAGSVTFIPQVGSTKTEVPPWIIPGGWRSYFFVDGTNGYVGSEPQDMISNSVISMSSGLAEVTSADGCTGANMFPWRRNYYGIYSALYINHPTQGPISLGFVHGEDRSMIGVNQPAVSCDPGQYYAYGGFACAAWTPNNQNTNWGQQYFTDLGPIIWPSMGYFLPNGQKCSGGIRHPTCIQADDGYIYVFYKDESGYVVQPYPGFAGDPAYPIPEGRAGGIKVARVPVNDALNPQAYRSFYEDPSGNQSWNPSLPAGFTRDNTTAFFRTMGPQSSEIMKDGNSYIRFAAAKVSGTNYYFGVGVYNDLHEPAQRLKLALRYSYDLVHWYGNLVMNIASDWTTTHYDYPIFLSSDGWSNTTILANDFYVVGTQGGPIGHVVYKMHVYIPAPPPPPPPPPPPNPCDPGNLVYQKCPAAQTATASEMAAVLDESIDKAPFVYPNPGHGLFTLTYTLKDHAITQLNVLDVTGRQLQAGSTSMRTPGRYTETVNITSGAKGVYLLELLVNGGKKTFKVIYQ